MFKVVLFLFFVSSICSSCVAYRYFPAKQQFYGFDSARDFRIVLEPSIPLDVVGTLGMNVSAAYSPANHFAVCAQGFSRTTASVQSHSGSQGLNYNQYNQSSWNSYALGGGAGIGYYNSIDAQNAWDIFLNYDIQYAYYSYSVTHHSPYDGHRVSMANLLHTFSIQPSFKFKQKSSNLYIGLPISGVFTAPPHYYEDAPELNGMAYDIIIAPGFAIEKGKTQFGSSVNVSTLHAFSDDEGASYQMPFNLYVRWMLGKTNPNKIHRQKKKWTWDLFK